MASLERFFLMTPRWVAKAVPSRGAVPWKAAVLSAFLAVIAAPPAWSLQRQDIEFKVFQFPPDMIPRIDGNADDWSMVPDSYAIGLDQFEDTEAPGGHGTHRDPKDLDIKVKVGWVKGLNRLYVLYEAYDNYWDFSGLDLHNDIFEVAVDGDLSGGPFIDMYHRDVWTKDAVGALSDLDPRINRADAYHALQGVHGQNYHIFTPPGDKDWAMAWNCAQYTKEMPYANHAVKYDFKPGQSGRLVLEFWITPFDYAGCEGPARAVESVLTEGKLIGLSFGVLDYDDAISKQRKFWNLSHKQTFYANGSDLVAFRLMPLEPQFQKPLAARWAWHGIEGAPGRVAFEDQSQGTVTAWHWDFGDGTVSAERSPTHQYEVAAGRQAHYTVVLEVSGPAGTSRLANVWSVHVP